MRPLLGRSGLEHFGLRMAAAALLCFLSMSLDPPAIPVGNAASFKFAVVAAQFNGRLADGLLAAVVRELRKAGVKERNLTIVRVPGSNEVPYAIKLLAKRKLPDAAIALGVLIRGDTIHYELIASAASDGLQRVALETLVPVINGIIVAENAAQAEARCLGSVARGAEFARTAIAMAALKRELSR